MFCKELSYGKCSVSPISAFLRVAHLAFRNTTLLKKCSGLVNSMDRMKKLYTGHADCLTAGTPLFTDRCRSPSALQFSIDDRRRWDRFKAATITKPFVKARIRLGVQIWTTIMRVHGVIDVIPATAPQSRAEVLQSTQQAQQTEWCKIVVKSQIEQV